MKKTFLISILIIMTVLNVFCETNKEWSFFVFMNGDNDLESYGVYDINEMEMVGSDDNVNIVVQFDRSKQHGVEDGNWNGARRYYIKKDDDKNIYGKINSELIEELGEVDSGDWKEAVSFFKWGVEKYPAKKYAFIFWNHGSGWLKNNMPLVKGISYDEGSGTHINSPGLKKAVDSMAGYIGRKIDIVAFDACLMNMIEVGVQMEDSVRFMCGSEESVPGGGMEYKIFLTNILKEYKAESDRMAEIVCESFEQAYKGKTTWMYLTSVTYSGVDLQNINLLTEKVDRLSKNLIEEEDQTYMIDVIKKVQRYDGNMFADLKHFCELVKEFSKDNNVKMACNDIISDFNKFVFFNWWQNDKLKDSNGLSIFLPSKEKYKEHYKDTEFAKKTRWDEFLRKYLKIVK